jgi:hypothetical protein
MIGAALFMQSSATLGAPQIKQVYFSVGKLPSNAGEITVGWLGACIYDTSTKWQTCCLPSYPLDVTNFGSIDGRLKAVADIFSSNTKTRSLAFNPAAAVCTFVALIMHRVARNRGPFYFTCVACAMAYLAFFIDVSVFLPSNKDMVSKAGLESSWGLALLFMGLSAVALTPAIFVSYSRSVKAQTNWPDRDPAPKVTMGPAVGPEGGGMGAPMGGEGGMPMGGEGGMPMGGEGGMPPMGKRFESLSNTSDLMCRRGWCWRWRRGLLNPTASWINLCLIVHCTFPDVDSNCSQSPCESQTCEITTSSLPWSCEQKRQYCQREVHNLRCVCTP